MMSSRYIQNYIIEDTYCLQYIIYDENIPRYFSVFK